MHPVLFSIGNESLSSYCFFYGLGLCLASMAAIALGRIRGLSFRATWIACFVSVFLAFLCARIFFLLIDPSFRFDSSLDGGGEVSFGGFFGAVLGFVITSFFLRMPIRDMLDLSAPCLFLAEGIQRIGCFCAGCCYGPVTMKALAIRFPRVEDASGNIIGSPCFVSHLSRQLVDATDFYSLPVMPMQLYSMGLALGVSAFSGFLFVTDRARGRLLWFAVLVYGMIRFPLQAWRPNYDLAKGYSDWNTGHTMCVVMICLGCIGILLTTRKCRVHFHSLMKAK